MAPALEPLRRLRGQPWLALDTETTGLGPYDAVIEIALVASSGAVVAETLVAPPRPITRRATEVHGLAAADLAQAPPWPTVWPMLQAHLRAAHTVLAWNAAFDLRLLRQTCVRYHLPLQTPRFLCLRRAFQDRHPLTRSTLAAACLALGIAARPEHRALPDAEVARQVAWKLIGEEPRSTTDLR